jgi:hypothetical protein
VAGCKIIYKEHASGADRHRPELARALAGIREGDTLVVTRLDRLARSVRHLLEVIDHLREKGAAFRSLGDPVDTSTPQGVFTVQILGAVAELERQLIASRTRAGLKAAIARGARPGNPGVRAGDKEAIAKIQRGRHDTHLSKVLAQVDTWLPLVRKMRPATPWKAIVKVLNDEAGGGGPWNVERLMRAVRLLVNEHMAEPALMGRAPRRPAKPGLAVIIAGIRLANPDMTLSQVARQLEEMQVRSPRGKARWTASMVVSASRLPVQ